MPVNHNIIKDNLKLNSINNVTNEKLIVSNFDGLMDFAVENNNANSHISEIEIKHANSSIQEIIKIKSVKLDSYIGDNRLSPNVIKVDVEGAEIAVLEGAMDTLRTNKLVCLISTHGQDCQVGCQKILKDLGYKVEQLKGFEHELCCFPN